VLAHARYAPSFKNRIQPEELYFCCILALQHDQVEGRRMELHGFWGLYLPPSLEYAAWAL